MPSYFILWSETNFDMDVVRSVLGRHPNTCQILGGEPEVWVVERNAAAAWQAFHRSQRSSWPVNDVSITVSNYALVFEVDGDDATSKRAAFEIADRLVTLLPCTIIDSDGCDITESATSKLDSLSPARRQPRARPTSVV